MDTSRRVVLVTVCAVALSAGCSPPKAGWPTGGPPASPPVSTGPVTGDLNVGIKDRHQVSKADLAFGQMQLRQMLTDRPDMKLPGIESSGVWAWARRQFAGAGLGKHISWSNEPPWRTAEAEHAPGYQGSDTLIRLARKTVDPPDPGRPFKPSEEWSRVLYELSNASHDPGFVNLYEQAVAGQIDRKSYVRECARLEYLALRQNHEVYETLWKPYAAKAGLDSAEFWDWGEDWDMSFDEWLAGYTDPKGYPDDPYGRDYDDIATWRRSFR